MIRLATINPRTNPMQTISISAAAKRMNVSYHTVRKWVDAGLLETKRFPDDRLRIPVDELTRFYDSLPSGSENREIRATCEPPKASH